LPSGGAAPVQMMFESAVPRAELEYDHLLFPAEAVDVLITINDKTCRKLYYLVAQKSCRHQPGFARKEILINEFTTKTLLIDTWFLYFSIL
jgi:hypothetical protein